MTFIPKRSEIESKIDSFPVWKTTKDIVCDEGTLTADSWVELRYKKDLGDRRHRIEMCTADVDIIHIDICEDEFDTMFERVTECVPMINRRRELLAAEDKANRVEHAFCIASVISFAFTVSATVIFFVGHIGAASWVAASLAIVGAVCFGIERIYNRKSWSIYSDRKDNVDSKLPGFSYKFYGIDTT